MGALIEIILGFLFEILLYILVEILAMFGLESIAAPFRNYKAVNKCLALAGCFLLGAILGSFVNFLFPKHLFDYYPLPGISLAASPLIAGYIMMKLGEIRKGKNKTITILATFGGGALFAFAFSLTRFLFVK